MGDEIDREDERKEIQFVCEAKGEGRKKIFGGRVEKIYVLEKMGDRMACGEIKVEGEISECK